MGTGRSVLAKGIVLITAIGLGAGGAWYLSRNNQLEEVRRQLAVKEEQLKTARASIANLLGERRAAEVIVEDERVDSQGDLVLTVKWLEYGAEGAPLKPARSYDVKGREVYFDAMVIMYKPDQVMQGKARSLYLFRRIFTDRTRPDQGVALWRVEDESQDVPERYRVADAPLEAQRAVWQEIRRLIHDESYRNEQGVRTIFGQAVSAKLEKKKIYKLSIQDSGGLLLEEAPVPDILQ